MSNRCSPRPAKFRGLWSRVLALLCLAGAALAWAPDAPAQAAAPATAASAPFPTGIGPDYSAKGADTCIDCHDADADTASFTTAGIFKGKHAQRGHAQAPFGRGGLQCEACHGPGARHSDKRAKPKLTINSLKRDSFLGPAERNQPCLDCHQDRSRNAWHGGAHDKARLACTDCHQLHTGNDKVLSKRTEAEVCFNCHKQQRADFAKASAHPVANASGAGRMACSDCHTTHGSSTQASLKQPGLNQTCFTCHADKRGPVLWEHAPVAEDCSTCHTAHGSVRPALLTASPPLLCQQCHTVAGHPSVSRTAAALPGSQGGTGAGGQVFLLAGSCTNCHSQVHGSNHPAGAKLMR